MAINRICAAYAVAEIGEMLIEYENMLPTCNYDFGFKWRFTVYNKKLKRVTRICADTEADARAKMWIHLKKHNMMSKKCLKIVIKMKRNACWVAFKE